MKNRYIVSAFMALAVLFSCVPDSRNDNMPDSVVYFVDNVANNGVQSAVMYDVQSTVDVPVYVYCAGLNGGNPSVSAKVAAEYIEQYNALKNTSYQPLPEECFELTKGSDKVKDRKANFILTFDVAAVNEFAATGVDLNEYVVCLELDSDEMAIGSYKEDTFGHYIVFPELKNATVKVSGVSLSDTEVELTVELPFENKWNFNFELDFGAKGCYGTPDTKRGNTKPAKYACYSEAPAALVEQVAIEGGEFNMAPGVNKKTFKLTVPAEFDCGEWEKGKNHNYAVSVKNAKLSVDGVEKDVPVEGAAFLAAYAPDHKVEKVRTSSGVNGSYPNDRFSTGTDADYYEKSLLKYGLELYTDDNTYIWSPESSNNVAWLDRLFNGNATDWQASWGGGYGFTSGQTDLHGLVDMRTVQPLNGLEWWKRANQFVTDTRRIEFYAIDDCTYEWKTDKLEYAADALTYLGCLDFGDGNENLGFIAFDYVETRYLLVYFARSNRTNCYDCTELNLWH